jgi:hypothetical protein
MHVTGRWTGLWVAMGLAACSGGGSASPTAVDSGRAMEAGLDGSTDMDASDGAAAKPDNGIPVDLGTGADGFSTWQPGTPYPPVDHLVTDLHVNLTLSYGNASAHVEEVTDARAGGVSYFFNFADALGRYVYISREGCAFDDVHAFKVVTAGESSGPIAVSAQGVANLEISLSNPSDVRSAPLTEADLPPGAMGACRALDMTSFEYEGLALVRHVTVGVRVLRTAARCEVFCSARGDASPGCRSGCLSAPLPFTGQITYDLDPGLLLTAARPPSGGLTWLHESNALDGNASLILE